MKGTAKGCRLNDENQRGSNPHNVAVIFADSDPTTMRMRQMMSEWKLLDKAAQDITMDCVCTPHPCPDQATSDAESWYHALAVAGLVNGSPGDPGGLLCRPDDVASRLDHLPVAVADRAREALRLHRLYTVECKAEKGDPKDSVTMRRWWRVVAGDAATTSAGSVLCPMPVAAQPVTTLTPIASSPAAALPEPVAAPAESVPVRAAGGKAKKPRRSWWNDVLPHFAEKLRAGGYQTMKALSNAIEAEAGLPASPFDIGTDVNRGKLVIRQSGIAFALKTMQNRWEEVRAAAAAMK